MYKFHRFPYGIKSVPEAYQSRFKEIFNIEGVDTYIDDLLVWGNTKQEHDKRLKEVLSLARLNNVKFNLQKCKFGQSEIIILALIIIKLKQLQSCQDLKLSKIIRDYWECLPM